MIVFCIMYRRRKEEKDEENSSNQQTNEKVERYLRSISVDESDCEIKDKKDKSDNGTMVSRNSDYYINPTLNGQNEQLAQLEEILGC